METIVSNVTNLFLPMLNNRLMGLYGIDPILRSNLTTSVLYTLLISNLLLTNIIRAFRYCRDDKGRLSSFGVVTGLKSAILTAILTFVSIFALNYLPESVAFISGFLTDVPVIGSGLALALFAFIYQYFPSRLIFGYC